MGIDDLKLFARYATGLPRFLRHPMSLEESRARVERQMKNRAESFLTILRRAVYARPRSPYARLLSRAGIGYGDVAALVRREGVEAALGTLLDAGVFLAHEEFKERRPVSRPAWPSIWAPLLPRGF